MMLGDLTNLRGIGDRNKGLFSQAGIKDIYSLLNYYPREYYDYSKITQVANSRPGPVTLQAKIEDAKGRYVRRGLHITEAVAVDQSGSIKLVWFNQPYRAGGIKLNEDYFITGKLEFKSGRYQIISPAIEAVSDHPVHTARIVPIYRETKGLGNKLIRKAMADAVSYSSRLADVLPETFQQKYSLLSYPNAIKTLHFPQSSAELDKARRTMSFIEIFELMLASRLLKKQIASQLAPKIKFDELIAKDFVSRLDYKLTDAQRKVMWRILQDIDSDSPMNRLVEGDVGSGKTVVASMAIIMALHSGQQVAYMAPTEILARQHYDTLSELLTVSGIKINMHLLTGRLTKLEKNRVYSQVKTGKINLLVGTHALLHGIDIPELGLIIIDEQHRFGVDQRTELLKNNQLVPHVLSMTATPIPRSLALTLYGELDISLLDAMPPGRKTIITEIVSPNSRQKLNNHIKEQIGIGHQVYVVCPLIDKDSKVDSASVEEVYQRLKESTFKEYRVGLLHGKMKPKEKSDMMASFVSGDIDILVSTTVIEVGVNVPNATIMVIEGAERFGLAQMHQLRGRVGRSSDQAYCYVVPSDSKAPSKRLRAFSQVVDGFRLAELDLEIRGPGAIYGTMQHGALDLRFTDLSNHKLIATARQAVDEFMSNHTLEDYQALARRVRLAQAIVTLN